jgi:hypothetical protein
MMRVVRWILVRCHAVRSTVLSSYGPSCRSLVFSACVSV